MKITQAEETAVIEEEKTIVVTKPMITAFRIGTKDPNKDLHPPYVMGYQQHGFAERQARQYADSGSVYAGQDMRFHQFIRHDEPFSMPTELTEKGINVNFYNGETQAAAATVYYSKPEELPQEEAEPKGLQYVVDSDSLALFHAGLDEDGKEMDPLFALALSSRAAWEHFRNAGISVPEGRMMVYLNHRLRAYQPLSELGIGDEFYINLDSHNFSDVRHVFKASLSAVRPDRQKLYSVQFMMGKEEIEKILQ